jgi:hypothetical protein
MRPGATSIIDVHGRCSEETSESVSTTSALMCADVSSEQKRAAEFCLCLAEFCQVGCRLVLASARRPLALALSLEIRLPMLRFPSCKNVVMRDDNLAALHGFRVKLYKRVPFVTQVWL